MEFFEVIKARRSIRKYSAKPVPAEVIDRALDAAIIAPNSSNLQTWEFYWVQSPHQKSELVKACMSQGAARTAQELIVFVANRSLWKRNRDLLVAEFRAQNAPKFIFDYYEKLTPFLYRFHFLAPLKWLIFNTIGLLRPMARRPYSASGVYEVCIKSMALAAENFMLAISAQGFDTCPMEGFDETRVKRILNLKYPSRVVMVVSVGERAADNFLGKQSRVPRDWVVKKV